MFFKEEVMILPTKKKIKIVEDIQERVRSSKAIYFVDYKGLTVAEISALRRKLKEKRADLKVAKNTLLHIALSETQSVNPQVLEGPTGLVTAFEDPIAPLKVLTEFAKDKTTLKAKGGFLEGRFFSSGEMEALSSLPSKNELLAQIIGSLQAPILGLIWALQGTMTNLVFTLQAISQKES